MISNNNMTTEGVPIVDASSMSVSSPSAQEPSDADLAAFGSTLKSALEVCGFAIVTGHGITKKTIQRAKDAGMKFFSLEEEEKLRMYPMEEETLQGFLPKGKESIDEARPDTDR